MIILSRGYIHIGLHHFCRHFFLYKIVLFVFFCVILPQYGRGGWFHGYSFVCQPVDYSLDDMAVRVSLILLSIKSPLSSRHKFKQGILSNFIEIYFFFSFPPAYHFHRPHTHTKSRFGL